MVPLLLLCLGLVDKREWYDRTLQTCKHGHGGVLVLVSEPQIRRRMSEEGSGEETPIEHFRAKLMRARVASSESPTSVERVFSTIPALAAVVSNATLQTFFDDEEVEVVEADCRVWRRPPADATGHEQPPPWELTPPRRRASVQLSAPWNLDSLDGQRDSNYEYGIATGTGVHVYVLDTGVRISHNEFGGRARGGFSAFCQTGNEPHCVLNGGDWSRNGVIDDA